MNDPREDLRPGHWTNIKISVTGNSSAECSRCGAVVHDSFSNAINYCPNCGADMRGEQNIQMFPTQMSEREEEPEINPCRGCEDYDGKGGCLSHGGCGEGREDG